jgi:hypothetical protein
MGVPLAPGERVRVRRRRASSRTQLVAVAAVGGTLGYARYRLPVRARLAATLRVRDRDGRPSLWLTSGGVILRPQVDRWAPPPTAKQSFVPVPLPGGPTTFRECGTLAPADAGDAADFDRLWHLERNGPGWTGGDGAISVRLADGRIAWLFGDSFIGGVLPNGRRGAASRMVRNAVVVQDGACLTTAIGGTARWPRAIMQPAAPGEWYWPEAATADGQRLHVTALRVLRTGSGAWDFAIAGVDVVDLDLASFTVTARRTLPFHGAILWGSSILQAGETTYVYGVENRPKDARLYLARAGGAALGGGWQFYTGTGTVPWSSDPRAAAPLRADDGSPVAGLSPAITVVAAPQGVILVSQAPMFGAAITVRRAPAPSGPFSAPQTIATAAAPPGAFTYNAILHPELAADGLQLLSWNVNVNGDLLRDATLYRPRFEAVEWPPGD